LTIVYGKRGEFNMSIYVVLILKIALKYNENEVQ